MAKKTSLVVKRRSASGLGSGRANQKARTRAALVEAAISLIDKGKVFTVGDVADLALVSRTTAYNYFPTAEALYAQAALSFVSRGEWDFSEHFNEKSGLEERVEEVIEASHASVVLHEQLYRAVLKVSLDLPQGSELPRRTPYRVEYLSKALEPWRGKLDQRRFQRLLTSLALCTGIEAHVTLVDVCGLSAEEARRVKVATAHALVTTALREKATRSKRT